MSVTAAVFLERWRNFHLSAEVISAENADEAVRQCLDDATRSGVPAEALTKAAGGDLRGHILAALKN
jgi:hypothetical protein